MKNRSRLLIAAVLGMAAPSTVLAQQELYALGRQNIIYRLDGYQTSAVVPVAITTWGTDGTVNTPTGLEVDPNTGDFLVLASPWNEFDGDNTEIVRVDPVSGAGQVIMTLPGSTYSGLDRRWDGKLYTLRNNGELWLVDLETNSTTVQALSKSVGALRPGLTVDDRGAVLSETGALDLIDPIGGMVQGGVIPDPMTPIPLGLEYDLDGSIYSASGIALLNRYDPITATWSLVLDTPNVLGFIFDLAFVQTADGVGFSQVCDGLPNSTGAASTLELLGTSDTANNDLELVSRNLPPGISAFYLLSQQTASIQVGDGVLCLGSPIFRYSNNVLVSDASGTVRFPLNLGQLAGGQVALPGDSYNFQLWHRDFTAGPTSNLSAAVNVTFD